MGLNDPAQHERIEAELRASIDVAVRYGVPGVICFSGNRRDGQSEEDAIAATVQGFRRVAPYAEQKGVNLNLELLNSLVDHPGYQCDHSAWGLEVCKQVNSPRVKLLFDIYHMQIMEGNLIQTITREHPLDRSFPYCRRARAQGHRRDPGDQLPRRLPGDFCLGLRVLPRARIPSQG